MCAYVFLAKPQNRRLHHAMLLLGKILPDFFEDLDTLSSHFLIAEASLGLNPAN
jgi:hypothetical protein